MRNFIYLVVAFYSFFSYADLITQEVESEERYFNIIDEIRNIENIKRSNLNHLKKINSRDLIYSLWDANFVYNLKGESRSFLKNISKKNLDTSDYLRYLILKRDLKEKITESERAYVKRKLKSEIIKRKVDAKSIYTILNNLPELSFIFSKEDLEGINNFSEFKNWSDVRSQKHVSQNQVRDLYYKTPDLKNFKNGEYSEGIRLFMFCRKNRNYPCMMIMKDKLDRPVYLDDKETLWHSPSLAQSSRSLPSYKRNGSTPSGVHLINSVMPKANRKIAFGKFRRLILNFVPRSVEEAQLKKLIPLSSHKSSWWKESVIARDVGRKYLRIHGTGRRNFQANSPHYPFRKTSGCVSKREGKYPESVYIDQRNLLDQMMLSLKLPATYKNEVKIKGLLWIVNIDDQRRPVIYKDIQQILNL